MAFNRQHGQSGQSGESGSAGGGAGGVWCMIGGGNMGGSIAHAALHSGDLGRFIVAERDGPSRDRLECDACESATRAMEWLIEREDPREPAPIVLAVKPQMLTELALELRPFFEDRSRVVVSVLAGTPGTKVRGLLGANARVIRTMPNLPAAIGLSCTAICVSAGAHAGDEDFAMELFRSVGPTVLRIPEELMDAFTAVAGSGPAYLFYLAEAMTRAAVKLGFEAATADAAVRATLFGAAAMLKDDPRTAEALRAAVTSKGGTTAAATARLDSSGVPANIVKAIEAACERGRELASM